MLRISQDGIGIDQHLLGIEIHEKAAAVNFAVAQGV
jgi:hypothetical protein